MFGTRLFLVCLIILNASCYLRKKLDCDFLHKKEGLVCIIFDLEVYDKLTRITEVTSSLSESTVIGVYIMSSTFYYLPNHIFRNFPDIQELKIISDIPALMEIDGKDFINLNKLKRIQIIGQKIRRLEARKFRGAPNIISLYLPYNQIEVIHEQAFSGISELMFLVLSNNRIKSLDFQLFFNLPKLWSLNLENNRLFKISEDIFSNNLLMVCDLSYNLLLTIPYQPIAELLHSNNTEMNLFSVRENLCQHMRDTIFSSSLSRLSDIDDLIEKCQTLKPLYNLLPKFCYSSKCSQCITTEGTSTAPPSTTDAYTSMNNDVDVEIFQEDEVGEYSFRNERRDIGPRTEPCFEKDYLEADDNKDDEIAKLVSENAKLKEIILKSNCYDYDDKY